MKKRIVFGYLLLLLFSYVLHIYTDAIFIATFKGFGDPCLTANCSCNIFINIIFIILILVILGIFTLCLVWAKKLKQKNIILITILCLVFCCILGLIIIPNIFYKLTNTFASDLGAFFIDIEWIKSTDYIPIF